MRARARSDSKSGIDDTTFFGAINWYRRCHFTAIAASPPRRAGEAPPRAGQETVIMSATLSPAAEPRFADRTLSDIAATLPGATEVFRRRKLDFCCGGRVPLGEAAIAKGLDVPELEAELGAIAALALPAPLPVATADLIDLIVARYHAVHRRELPELIELARRVEVVHKAHPVAPHGLADLLERMAEELEDHMRKEEQILFPLMRRGGGPMVAQPIAAMLADHDDHGAHLRALETLTNDFAIPDEACATWRALYLGAHKFADDLVEHIHTENNVLFPRFTG
ncbi:iron-sulfur cluster repair protein YtfE [Limobrevibacterium gyesilva]|uniref:Iron-sulfur cluster repair protein YtfE n=1 Tax=Limobrevibacterium gyesilva TaxID=2991712 RepID=A0AA42CER4_9PROT|nr:iron-sulfur cluster repair protein YtfE [Limobrevibacterium gyesilva]MCW3476358.1 iron-sulfur cluster repair protein YtfE [Limobrevibacterium gyesilva]